MTMQLPTILPGAEPFFFRGSPTGCLCLHGFMSSPAEIRWLGQHLAGQGYTVYGPRLTGHGVEYRHMARMRWADWYTAALDGYHVLRAQCEHVFVVGHSMGGVLAMLLAASQPVDGLAVLAAPYRFTDRRMAYAHVLRYALRFTDQSDKTPLPNLVREEQQRRDEPVLGRVRYDRWSTAAVAQLRRLAMVTSTRLQHVTVPLLLVHSAADPTIPLANQAQIADAVRSTVIERHVLEHSGHIIVQDTERDRVFAWVADFVATYAGTTKL